MKNKIFFAFLTINLSIFVLGCKNNDIKEQKPPIETLENLKIMSSNQQDWSLTLSSGQKNNDTYSLKDISLENAQGKLRAAQGKSQNLNRFELSELTGSYQNIYIKINQSIFHTKRNTLQGKNVSLSSKFWALEAKNLSGDYPFKKLQLNQVKGTYKR